MSKRVKPDTPVIRRGGWTTGFPVTQNCIKAISMNGTLIYLVAVSDYRVKDFAIAVDALRTFSEDWSRQQREKIKPRRVAKPQTVSAEDVPVAVEVSPENQTVEVIQ